MKVSQFDYELPEELIAQQPAADRADSRMLVVDRGAGTWEDRRFRELPEFIGAGDRLVLNNTRVLPARLFGRRAGVHATTSKSEISGLAETLLVKQVRSNPLVWEALVRPGRKIRVGEVIRFPGGLEATVLTRGEYGLRSLEFRPAESFAGIVERIGHMPLPPYIKRADCDQDRARYQTVYATKSGSAAAPTAGLHFTPEILAAIERRGATRVEITLDVGLGTFQPVRVEQVEEHPMHAERFEISEEAARNLGGAGRILAVGTTSVRTLEHAARAGGGSIRAGAGETDIFIYPGFEFRAVDALLTNFHLPRSTLLMLVSAFAGCELTPAAYRHAVAERYRFYSYGDCMLIV